MGRGTKDCGLHGASSSSFRDLFAVLLFDIEEDEAVADVLVRELRPPVRVGAGDDDEDDDDESPSVFAAALSPCTAIAAAFPLLSGRFATLPLPLPPLLLLLGGGLDLDESLKCCCRPVLPLLPLPLLDVEGACVKKLLGNGGRPC